MSFADQGDQSVEMLLGTAPRQAGASSPIAVLSSFGTMTLDQLQTGVRLWIFSGHLAYCFKGLEAQPCIVDVATAMVRSRAFAGSANFHMVRTPDESFATLEMLQGL